MVNRNDLRYIKTEALLRSTYLQFCREGKKGLTVTELCRTAQINKSTFYAHYPSIEELHREVCRESIRDMLQGHRELACLFTEPEAFVRCIGSLFRTHLTGLRHLFPTWKDAIDPVEEVILEMYITPDTPESWEGMIRFCAGGVLRLLSHSQSRQSRALAVELIRKTLA